MNWIDIRVRKPTKADADDDGYIFQKLTGGRYTAWHWDSLADCVAWCPTSDLPKFTPIPDPPEGYRWIDQERDKPKRQDDLYWSETGKSWKECVVGADSFCRDDAYARRIEPPKPQYRPFANAAEFEPYEDDWVWEESRKCKVTVYCDSFLEVNYRTYGWDEALERLKKADGTPFGIKVE
jgi:hypothetical protein